MTELTAQLNEAETSTREGHLSVLKGVYEAYGAQLRSVLARLSGPGLDADDLLHEVFLVALKRPDIFQSAADQRPWLYGVAVKVATAARRRSRVRRFFGLDDADEPIDPYTPDDALKKAEARKQVYGALEKLSEKKRTVFILFELEGLSGEEIAKIVGAPVKTVWTRLHHARREFEHELSRQEERS